MFVVGIVSGITNTIVVVIWGYVGQIFSKKLTTFTARISADEPWCSVECCLSCCVGVDRLARTGFEELDTGGGAMSNDANDSSSSGTPHHTVSFTDDPRIPLSTSLLVELLTGVYYAL